jgi:1-acyl-sn-glycerol-3-phosphate acyltransferase
LLRVCGVTLQWGAVALVAECLKTIAPVRCALVREFVIQRWAQRVAHVLALQFDVRGLPPRGPMLCVSNHLSYLDILVFAALMPATFVAKVEVASWPIIGTLSRLSRPIFLNRQRKRDLLRVVEEMMSALRRGCCVAFFPEGTSTAGEAVLPFKSSLFEAVARVDVTVACASLKYETGADDPPARDAVCWWGDMSLAPHLYQLLQLRSITVTVEFGRDLVRGKNRKLLAAESWRRVVRHFVATDVSVAKAWVKEVDREGQREKPALDVVVID